MKKVRVAEADALVVREPLRRYKKVGDVPLPPPLRLKVDALELLLEDRRSEK